MGNPESSETAAEIVGNTYGGCAGAPQGNIKFTISNVSTSACAFLTIPISQRTDFVAFSPLCPKKKKQTPLPLPFYLFVHTCTRVSVCTYVCDRFRRICNILFCIENDLGAIRVPLEPYAVSFLSVHRGFHSCHRESSRRSLHPPRGPGRLPRAKTTCLSIFPVALLRVIKVSSFSLSLFSLSSPPSPFFFSHPILLSSSIWRGLLFSLSLSLTPIPPQRPSIYGR